jgi:hypothetical protein
MPPSVCLAVSGAKASPLRACAEKRQTTMIRLAELGIRHRRGGYRDPEGQAFIESWFGKLKEGRCG